MNGPHSILIGGTKGVGRELATLLADRGEFVTVVGRSDCHFESPRIECITGDVTASEQLLGRLGRQIERHGKLSSLVFLQRHRGNGDAWTGELAVSLTATKILVESLVQQFDPEGIRSICIVASNAGTFVARNQSLGYHTAKAALRQMARFYAVKFGPQRIRVNVVAPCTFVKSESKNYYSGQVELQDLYKRITPLGRMGTAKEIARAIAFLCSDDASFITGQELTVDGGLSLMLQDALARELSGLAS